VVAEERLDPDHLEHGPADDLLHLLAGQEMTVRRPGRVPVHDDDGRAGLEGGPQIGQELDRLLEVVEGVDHEDHVQRPGRETGVLDGPQYGFDIGDVLARPPTLDGGQGGPVDVVGIDLAAFAHAFRKPEGEVAVARPDLADDQARLDPGHLHDLLGLFDVIARGVPVLGLARDRDETGQDGRH